MERGERTCLQTILTALYLRGLTPARPAPKSRWLRVVDVLRTEVPHLGSADAVLRHYGFWEESQCLTDPGRLDKALELVQTGQVLTIFDPVYPASWVRKLGSQAPPVLWCRGNLSPLFAAGEGVGIVGSRQIGAKARHFAYHSARTVIESGKAVVTGGAVGSDSAAMQGCQSLGDDGLSRLAVLVPFGLDRAARLPGGCVLSACEPWADFSTASAMERNALIYAMGSRALIAESDSGSGGTWHGATGALRKRLCQMGVREDAKSVGLSQLAALGARRLSLEDLSDFLVSELDPSLSSSQASLFGVDSLNGVFEAGSPLSNLGDYQCEPHDISTTISGRAQYSTSGFARSA